MNKAELVDRVVENTETTKKDTELIVDEALKIIAEVLRQGDKVKLSGFGNFEVRARAARRGRNPQTGEEIDIAASKTPAFKPAPSFKASVN